ncbi:hypothetical protein DPMN_070712 [Dreissena polymorpha]|uniref:Uncharacterized protein n=1 Tax=Dreissena polymorpha TaxID=45954 RepID=A0A9D3Z1H6_DREPO|nr:hypothetical protein DPMN_070712 [Dreissena polymorpha]
MDKDLIQRMIGDANLDEIKLNGIQTTALIDSGSQVSTITEVYYEGMSPKPKLYTLDEFGLELTCENVSTIPYSGYILADIETEFTDKPIQTILIIKPVKEYHGTAHDLLGKNVLRELKYVAKISTINDVWAAGFMSVNTDIEIFTDTKPITLHPCKSRTVTGFYRKQGIMNEAVTEPIEDIQCHSAIICPRVVRIDTLGKTARIPVRKCNMTTRPIKIKAKQTL